MSTRIGCRQTEIQIGETDLNITGIFEKTFWQRLQIHWRPKMRRCPYHLEKAKFEHTQVENYWIYKCSCEKKSLVISSKKTKIPHLTLGLVGFGDMANRLYHFAVLSAGMETGQSGRCWQAARKAAISSDSPVPRALPGIAPELQRTGRPAIGTGAALVKSH